MGENGKLLSLGPTGRAGEGLVLELPCVCQVSTLSARLCRMGVGGCAP